MAMSELFWTTLYTGAFAFILTLAHFCYKSKCTKVSICCITFERDVKAEEELDMEAQKHPTENKTSSV